MPLRPGAGPAAPARPAATAPSPIQRLQALAHSLELPQEAHADLLGHGVLTLEGVPIAFLVDDADAQGGMPLLLEIGAPRPGLEARVHRAMLEHNLLARPPCLAAIGVIPRTERLVVHAFLPGGAIHTPPEEAALVRAWVDAVRRLRAACDAVRFD